MQAPRIFEEPPPEARELELPAFLEWLGGPAIFHLRGATSARCRLLSGGLHGNEPSGFYTVHQLLRDPPPLPCDAVLLLGNVAAALFGRGFAHRLLPGEEDMNRVWSRLSGSPQRELAGRIVGHLREQPLEAIVDLHNNTGFNPIYAVVIDRDVRRRQLGRIWTRLFVNYEGIRLGTFLEAFQEVPGVVIECGQAGDPASDRRGLEGARSYLMAEDPLTLEAVPGEDRMYRSLARVTIPADVAVDFAEFPTGGADLTISPSIDRFNFEVLPQGTRLAHRGPRGRLLVSEDDGTVLTERFLEHRDDSIVTRCPIIPVMMTTNGAVAKSDCLLYVAEQLPDA